MVSEVLEHKDTYLDYFFNTKNLPMEKFLETLDLNNTTKRDVTN